MAGGLTFTAEITTCIKGHAALTVIIVMHHAPHCWTYDMLWWSEFTGCFVTVICWFFPIATALAMDAGNEILSAYQNAYQKERHCKAHQAALWQFVVMIALQRCCNCSSRLHITKHSTKQRHAAVMGTCLRLHHLAVPDDCNPC